MSQTSPPTGQPDGPSAGPTAGQPGDQPGGQPGGQAIGIPAGRPGRYNRSFGGLVGAMIVMVVVVVLTWLALGLFRDEAEFEPLPIDYESSVQALVDNDAAIAYPEQLPPGWRVNNLAYSPDGPVFTLALLTDGDDFAGVYHGPEEAEDLEEVLDRLVDENAREGDPVELTDGEGATSTWQVWTDEGGDTAYVRVEEPQGEPVLTMVYGSAPAEDLRTVVGSLLTAG